MNDVCTIAHTKPALAQKGTNSNEEGKERKRNEQPVKTNTERRRKHLGTERQQERSQCLGDL